jgi:predicted Fe-S protein YdhL (DUF1289 family)
MTAHQPIDEAARRRTESPCSGICVIDPTTDCCQGCFRTLNEIAAWGQSSAVERTQILASVEHRKQQSGWMLSSDDRR